MAQMSLHASPFVRTGTGLLVHPAGRAPDPEGLCPGTGVMTMAGERPVEDLLPGDRIVTRDRGAVPLAGLERISAQYVPVTVLAAALNRQAADTVLPAGQRILVRDWRALALFGTATAIAPIRRLIDGEFIAAGPRTGGDLWFLSFERPHVIYAGGLEIAVRG